MRYGPGKFEACGNYSHIAEYIYENATDETLGDTESFGWFGKFDSKIKGVQVYAIVSEDSQGFVDVDYFDDAKELNAAWDKLQAEWDHAQGPDMQDDDIKLDHIPDVEECRKLCRQFREEEFWPNVWHVNDHGNVDLLAIGWDGAKIVRSWV